MFGSSRSYPGWNGLTLAEQMMWRDRDPEAAAIAAGEVTAEQEAWLCVNQLDPSMPQGKDKAAEYQAAMAEQLAKLQEWNANASAKREQREAFQRRQRQHLNSVRG